jgi:hypothetical protein
MNPFHSPEDGHIVYVSNLIKERGNLARMFGPTDFFNMQTAATATPGYPGFLLLQQKLRPLIPDDLWDSFGPVKQITLRETMQWQLFEYECYTQNIFNNGKTINRYVVNIFDDTLALQYKLTYK